MRKALIKLDTYYPWAKNWAVAVGVGLALGALAGAGF